MKKNNQKFNIVNLFFTIAIIICILATIFSVISFTLSYCQLSNEIANINETITSDFNDILKMLSKNEDNTMELLEQIDLTNTQISGTISQLERLQEIEYEAVSHNVLTFLYSFLCSVLVGIGTYYVNQCIKYTTDIKKAEDQISQNKNEVETLGNTIKEVDEQISQNKNEVEILRETIKSQNIQTLELSFFHQLQLVTALLDNIKNVTNAKNTNDSAMLFNYIPRLNTEIQSLNRFVVSMKPIDKEDMKVLVGRKLLFALNTIITQIESLPTDYSKLITVKSKENLLIKIQQTKEVFEC